MRYCDIRLSENPALAGIKHLNRLENVLARAEWNDPDIAEGLVLDASGFVIEGTMSNLFIVQEGILMTPDISGCGVEGIMRSIVFEAASSLGISLRVLQITPQDVIEADEIFICNSLINIWPVRQLDQHSCIIGEITKQLMQQIQMQNRQGL
jgi:4-amino-4-deoxychorismate lyase